VKPTAGALPEGGSNMLDWIIATGGVALFCVLLFFWVRWTDLERKLFAKGNGRHLE
jgi:hypothetical protein